MKGQASSQPRERLYIGTGRPDGLWNQADEWRWSRGRRPVSGQWGMLIWCMGLVTVNVAGGIRDAAQVATSESKGIP
jgi:hypothetical protein